MTSKKSAIPSLPARTSIRFAGTREANHHRIAIVFQEIVLAPNMTVAENIYLGQEPRAMGAFVDRKALRAQASAAMARQPVQ